MNIDAWTQITDNAGLDSARMRLRGVVYDTNSAVAMLDATAGDIKLEQVALAGRRHSQGGQTLLDGGIALELGGCRDISIDVAKGTATVGAGATWNDLHLALVRERCGLAPVTHQSSPLFSIGGSLAVNCHGRFPATGPVSTSVESLTLWTPAKGQFTVTEHDKSDMFGMALGGFGAGAVILKATLRLQHETVIENATALLPTDAYIDVIQTYAKTSWPKIHYAWLDFSEENLFGSVLAVSGHEAGKDGRPAGPPACKDEPLVHDAVLESTLLRQAYGLVRRSDGRARDLLWHATTQLVRSGLPEHQRLLNAMRAPIRFTRHEDPDTVDLLQEYFVPISAIDPFLIAAADILRMYKVRLMSATLRFVQPDDVSILAYAKGIMACLVLNVSLDRREAMSASAAQGPYVAWNRFMIDLATELGGSFYLPYWRCATSEQIDNAYGNVALKRFAAARLAADPQVRLNNAFLDAYFR